MNSQHEPTSAVPHLAAPVVLVHGLSGFDRVFRMKRPSKEFFPGVRPHLEAAGNRVLMPRVSATASIATRSAELKAFIRREVGMAKVHVIGHSMGGYISLALAEKYPETLKGLGLFHATAYEDKPEKKESRQKSIEFIRKHGPAPYVRQSLPGLFSEHFKNRHPEKVQEQIGRYANFNPDSLVQYLDAMRNRKDKTRILQNMKIPALFLMGEEDPAAPLQDMLEQCHLPQISYIHILADTAHMGMLENTNLCNSFIDRFLEQISK